MYSDPTDLGDTCTGKITYIKKTSEPGQEVTSPLEVVGGRDGSRRDQEHPSREVVLFRSLYVHPDVVSGQSLAHVLVENLHVRHARLPLVAVPHNLMYDYCTIVSSFHFSE